jgi:hypothetical protein
MPCWRRALPAALLLMLSTTSAAPLITAAAVDPFANCGAGEAGIEVLRGELDSPFGLEQWCCGNTTWSSFSWRAKATRNVNFTVARHTPAVPGGRSNGTECVAHPTAPDCFSFCFNSSRGGPCSPPKGPTAPAPAACQVALDAVCSASSNAKCTNDTVKAYGQAALPLVGLYDGGEREASDHTTPQHHPLSRASPSDPHSHPPWVSWFLAGMYNSSTGLHPSSPAWRCYARSALDSKHEHWNGNAVVPLSCGQSNTALRGALALAFASTSTCAPVRPGLAAYPADTWTSWNDVRPSDLTTSRKNKNATSTVGTYYCQGYPNEYLDPVQHLVLNLQVRGIFTGNSSNVSLEIRPIRPAGPTYQIDAMVAPINGGGGAFVPGTSRSLSIPFMLARENLTTVASHLGPQITTAVRPLITEHEHNRAIFRALPQNKKTPRKIQVVQGYHGGNDVEGWLAASRALVGFGATGITAPASIPARQIFDAAGVVAARVGGGLRPPTNTTSHRPLEACKAATSDNGHCWGHSDAEVAANLKLWAESYVRPMRAAGFKTLSQFSLHDELGWSYPEVWAGAANISGNPRVFKRFQQYLKANSGLTTPQDFGADSWEKVVPITFTNITAGEKHEQALRVRVYWSIRFAAFDVVSFYSKATAALIAANDGEAFSIYTNTNNFHGRLFTPGQSHVQPGTGVVTQGSDRGGMDWMEAGRFKAGSMLWTEDWFAVRRVTTSHSELSIAFLQTQCVAVCSQSSVLSGCA